MWYLLPTDTVREGEIVALGFDWGKYDHPSEGDLKALWPDYKVKQIPIAISSCLVVPNRFTTVSALLRPAYGAGARKAVALRVDQPSDPAADIEGKVIEDLGKLNDFLFSPLVGKGDENGGLFSSAKTIALVIGGACLLVAGGFVAVKLMRKGK